MADLFNLFVTTEVSPYVTKTAEVVSVLKKDSKLDDNKYRPIPLLSDIEEILEKLTEIVYLSQ